MTQSKPVHSNTTARSGIFSQRNVLRLFRGLLLPMSISALAGGETPAQWEREWELGVQQRFYSDTGYRQSQQSSTVFSIAAQWQSTWQTDAGDLQQFTAKPYLRYDPVDTEGTRADFDELHYLLLDDRFSFKLGRSQVFWGVTESVHLVNVINQVDLIDEPNGERFIGQNMINLNLELANGTLEFYLLHGFEPRRFSGSGGRFSLPFDIDSHANYAPDHQSQPFDYALRWYQFLGPLELGLSYFGGTSRDPVFRSSDIQLTFSGSEVSSAILQPTYYTVDQFGIDAQLLLGDWAFKLEAISRHGEETWQPGSDRDYWSAAAGFEYTRVGVFGKRWDFGYIAEYVYDDRQELAPTFADNDLRLGLRWAFNDVRNSSVLASLGYDHHSHEQLITLEASSRVTENSVLEAKLWYFNGSEVADDTPQQRLAALNDHHNKAWFLQRDNFLELEWRFYF